MPITKQNHSQSNPKKWLHYFLGIKSQTNATTIVNFNFVFIPLPLACSGSRAVALIKNSPKNQTVCILESGR